MFVSSNKLTDVLPYFKRKLKNVYEEREIENIFFLLTEHYLSLSKIQVLGQDKRLTESELLDFREFVNRLQTGEPVQQIVGSVEFYGLKISVNKSTLIPRPETEELVDLICKKHKTESGLTVLDIGTGSGCIALALKKNLDASTVSAMDVSAECLQIASENARNLDLTVDFIQADILSEKKGTDRMFDLIVSNPPYIPLADKITMHTNVVNFEPHLALFVANSDPLIFYKKILDLGKSTLKKGGAIYFEINPAGGEAICAYALHGGYSSAVTLKDISGNDRFVVVR